MIKIRSLFSILFLVTFLNQIYGLDNGIEPNAIVDKNPIHRSRGILSSNSDQRIIKEVSSEQNLLDNISDFNKIKEIIEANDVNLNKLQTGHTIIQLVIENIRVFSSFTDVSNMADHYLKVLEYLLQNGADVNQLSENFDDADFFTSLNLLLKNPIDDIDFYKKLIIILLGYGAIVDDQILELALANEHCEEILPILISHKNLVDEAEANPTRMLLKEAIFFNKPYIVKLILDQKPELIKWFCLRLANITSPGSIPILKQGLTIAAFRKSDLAKTLPAELILYIENLTLKICMNA